MIRFKPGFSVGSPINEFLGIARLTLRDSLRRDLVHRALPLLESGYVGERRLRDALQCFFGEETLMTGDDDVGKGEQAREDVVTDDLIRQVFKEEIGLLLINVQAEIAYPARLQSFDHRLRVNQCATARVDQHHSGLHLSERLIINQVMCLRRQRAVQSDYVRGGEEMRS